MRSGQHGRDVIVTGSGDMTVRIWDGTGAPVGDLLDRPHQIRWTAVADRQSDGDINIVTGGDRSPDRAELETRGSYGRRLRLPAATPARVNPRWHRRTNRLVIDVIVTGSTTRRVRIWDRAGRPAGDLPTGHHRLGERGWLCGKWDGRDVIKSSGKLWDQTVRIWDGAGAPGR